MRKLVVALHLCALPTGLGRIGALLAPSSTVRHGRVAPMPSLAATILHPALDPPSARIRAHAWSRSVTDAVDAMERAGLELARAIPTHTRPVTTALAELHRLTVEADALRRRYNEASSAGEAGAAALKGHLQRTVRLARTRLDVLVRAVAARCGCRHARGHR